jgi:hypothetical protein
MAGTAPAATYTYTGVTFDNFLNTTSIAGNYTSLDRVTGSFEVADVLPEMASGADISALLTGFSFAGGRATFDMGSGIINSFIVSTDAAGQIVDWNIRLSNFVEPNGSNPFYPGNNFERLITRSDFFDPTAAGFGEFDQEMIMTCLNLSAFGVGLLLRRRT